MMISAFNSNIIERLHADEIDLRRAAIDTTKINLELVEFDSRMKRTLKAPDSGSGCDYARLYKYLFNLLLFIICWVSMVCKK
jgi:hypothetical protein